MLQFNLTPIEARVFGCLLEKEQTVPENYPLSLNSVAAACNQSTNREPIMSCDEKSVDAALYSLREKRLASMVHLAGARVQKHRHNLSQHLTLNPGEIAILTVLLLRGAQTPGELRSRTERMFAFNSLAHLEATLEELAKGEDPVVRMIPARPGQKERRYVELLSAETPLDEGGPTVSDVEVTYTPSETHTARIESLEQEVGLLRAELQAMREEFAAFRKQFE